jgi:hypothetical protein
VQFAATSAVDVSSNENHDTFVVSARQFRVARAMLFTSGAEDRDELLVGTRLAIEDAVTLRRIPDPISFLRVTRAIERGRNRRRRTKSDRFVFAVAQPTKGDPNEVAT